jgi:hypothetical protein
MNVELFNEGKKYALGLINNGVPIAYPVITSYDDEDDHWFQQGVIEVLEKTDEVVKCN